MIEFFKKLCYILYKKTNTKWSDIIKNSRRIHKEWLERRSRKILRKRTIRNAHRKRNIGVPSRHAIYNEHGNRKDNEYYATAPEILSISDNYEETISYFNGIFNDMNSKKFNRRYFFDVSNVKKLTNDAIIYILAIVYCIKKNMIFHYGFAGNSPRDQKANQLFQESGFFNYVNSSGSNLLPTVDKLQIISNNKTDGIAAGDVINFVSSFLNIDQREKKSKALYRVLIELMSNTANHAYKDNEGIMKKNWYIYAEKAEKKVKFVFLDTGLGIPATVRRIGFSETFGFKDDDELIYSAFTQNSRSQTKQENRGYGLPATYEICKASLLNNFTVVSGKGKCIITGDSVIRESLKSRFYGTMYYWEIN